VELGIVVELGAGARLGMGVGIFVGVEVSVAEAAVFTATGRAGVFVGAIAVAELQAKMQFPIRIVTKIRGQIMFIFYHPSDIDRQLMKIT
jgi:hypothetical protein